MKLIFELLTFLLLFVLFQGAIRRFLPKKATMQNFSPESLKALKRFRARYFQLLLLFIVIFGAAVYFLLLFVNEHANFMAPHFSQYYPLKDSAFWQPALLGGLLLGSLVAFSLNRRLQADGLSFYLEELQELAQGYQSFGTFRYIQYGIGLLLFTILSYSALSSGLGLDKASITIVKPWGKYEKYQVNELKKLDSNETTQLLINNTDTINTSTYKYQTKDLDLYISNFKPFSLSQ